MASDPKGYKVMVPELTVHQDVRTLRHPVTNEVTGYQRGLGKTYAYGEVIAPEKVDTETKEALADKDHPNHDMLSKKLEPVKEGESEDLALRLGLPFAGYEDMDEDDVLAAMQHMPSATQQRIKNFEAQNENRERIVLWNSGFGENSIDRQMGTIASPVDEDAMEVEPDKAASHLKTREVPADGPSTPGEGITGTGDPGISYGTHEDDDLDPQDIKGNEAAARKGRKPRQAKATPGVHASESDIRKAND